MEVIDFALQYASQGWPVIPVHSFLEDACTCGDEGCRSPGKHPLTANGVKDASVDPTVIRRWMDETSGLANIGIATGDGLIVVDIDAKSGGLESLAALPQRHGELPPTKTVATGGGGKHLLFPSRRPEHRQQDSNSAWNRHPRNRRLRCCSAVRSCERPALPLGVARRSAAGTGTRVAASDAYSSASTRLNKSDGRRQ